jgi:Major Facilitator Superfamily
VPPLAAISHLSRNYACCSSPGRCWRWPARWRCFIWATPRVPLYGLAVVVAHGNPFTTVASTVVIAQAVMIAAALAAMRIAQTRGYWLAILIAFTALPRRALIAASVITGWGVVPVQILDGVGAGMLSVAVPGLVARLLDGTGHINIGQGAVMTAQGIGAALSPALGGVIAQHFGFRAAFALLGALSLGALMIWLGFGSTLRRAGGPREADHDADTSGDEAGLAQGRTIQRGNSAHQNTASPGEDMDTLRLYAMALTGATPSRIRRR